MTDNSRFSLEKAIAAWRRTLEHNRAFLREDREELETHARDYFERLVAEGYSDEDAWTQVMQRMGDYGAVETEYRKVFWVKLRHKQKMLQTYLWELSMLKNYLKIATRNLIKHRGYTFINVSGLALGMACCLLIVLYVSHELSYDRYHVNSDQVYRVTREFFDENNTSILHLTRLSFPIAPAMEEELPEVERAVRVWSDDGLVSYEGRHFEEDGFAFADPAFFDVFTVPLLQGDPATALVEPNTMLVSQTMATKYFGAADPVGEVLQLYGQADMRVVGVFEDLPDNTHFDFSFLISHTTLDAWFSEERRNHWGSFNGHATYVLLAEGAQAADLQAKLPAFLRSHLEAENNTTDYLELQALTDIHLRSNFSSDDGAQGSITYIYMFSAIALFVLLIACFNFMNLATARSANRTREVGMRKVLGAYRSQLVKQFLGESTLLALVAMVLAIVLAAAVLPAFNSFTGKSLALFSSVEQTLRLLGVLLTLALGVGMVAGSYPAFFLSAFRPVAVLKGATGGSWRSRFRTVLVVAQFAISIVLLIGMGVVSQQLDFIQNKRLGLQTEQRIVLPATSAMQRDFGAVRDQLLTHPNIQAVTASRLVPGGRLVDHIGAKAEVNGALNDITLSLNPVDHDFLDVYGMEIAAGRTFSKDLASDSTQAFVLNETAVQLAGWASPEAAIDQNLTLEGNSGFRLPGQVVGVVKDFHFESLHEEIAPQVMFVMPQRYRSVTVKVAAAHLNETLAFLEERWQMYRPNNPFSYVFLDERFGALYAAEQQLGRMFAYFAGLAVFIACLGLFGLASFMTEQRRKEIGVRKVLGASVSSIVALLSKEFIKLVAVAVLVAGPIAYVVMADWLDSFVYQTTMGPGLFLIAGVVALGIALLTVSYQSIRAALADPAQVLHAE